MALTATSLPLPGQSDQTELLGGGGPDGRPGGGRGPGQDRERVLLFGGKRLSPAPGPGAVGLSDRAVPFCKSDTALRT